MRKPEIIRLNPGEGYPLQDPQRDVNFPQVNMQAETFGINLLTIMNQWQDHLTTIGPLQLGDVPKGKASALRTVGGMAMIAAQEMRARRLTHSEGDFRRHGRLVRGAPDAVGAK